MSVPGLREELHASQCIACEFCDAAPVFWYVQLLDYKTWILNWVCVGDCRLIMTLYLGIGDDFGPSNYINMSAVLFMWVVMPAFGAAAYVPSITLGKVVAFWQLRSPAGHVCSMLQPRTVACMCACQ